jgi:hypothetical protein
MRYSTLLFFLLIFSGHLMGQKVLSRVLNDTTKFDNRYYKQELGLGITGVFRGDIGSHLIWKIRDDRSKLVPVTYAHYWRVQVFTNSNTFTGYNDTIAAPNLGFTFQTPSQSINTFEGLIGREKVFFYNRFNVYYGWDAGPSYQYERTNSYNFYLFNRDDAGISDFYYLATTASTHSIGARGGGFVGVKYRISPRISLTFESGLSLFYNFNMRKISVNVNTDPYEGNKSRYHRFGHELDYLKFITLNYHFKRY